MDLDQFELLGHRIAQWAAHYLRSGRTRPVYHPMAREDHHAILDTALPEEGLPVEALFDWLEERVYPFPSPNNGPGSFAWITSPAARKGVLASWIAAVLNAHCGVGDHAAQDVERLALAHLMELVGFPCEGSQGILTSGGSMANLICLAVARHWYAMQHGWNVRTDGLQGMHHDPLVLYISREAHSSLSLAAQLLGLGGRFVQQIPTTQDARMDMTALRRQIEIDLAAGLRPWCVVSPVGSTPTGAIDPPLEVARVCADYALWHHGDGADGGFGVLVPELAPLYAGIDLLDSLSIDPHKMLCAPVGTGAALVRKGMLLRETFSMKPSYLHASAEEPWW